MHPDEMRQSAGSSVDHGHAEVISFPETTITGIYLRIRRWAELGSNQ